MRYVLTYDISDDGARACLAELLLDYGQRVQKSVFEAELSQQELKALLAAAAKWVQATDSFRAYPLCAACHSRRQSLGRETLIEPELRIV